MLALEPHGLRLNDGGGGAAPLPLWSGALHYFRTPPTHWRQALLAARDMGLPLIETYVPWGVHEVGRGHFRFTGPYDLGRFLDLCAEVGLRVILRPGPHINAELPWFGFPQRLCDGSDPALAARNGAGQPMHVPLPPRMFVAPSYASSRLYEETARWYAQVAAVVRDRLHPSGPVVALQVDNEQPLFFRTAPYDGDYHDEALAAWAAWQAARGHKDGEVAAPRGFPDGEVEPAGLLPHLRWVAFKEAQVVASLSRLAGLLRQEGLDGVPLFHNFPPAEPGPGSLLDVAAAEGVLSCAGIDMYHRRSEYARVRRRALYLLGSSRYPYVPEMGAGSFPWGPPLTPQDSQQTLLCALNHGVRGFNLYMLVDRDRWYGAPLSEAGQPRPEAAFYARLLAGLREAGAATLTADGPIGVLVPRGYGRLASCASHLGPLSAVWMDWLGYDPELAYRTEHFGLQIPVQAHLPRWRNALLAALGRQGRRWVLVDESCPLERLQKRRVLIVPTYDFLDRDLAARLRAFRQAGGALLIGPLRPTLDGDFAPCEHGLEDAPLLPADEAALPGALAALLPPLGDDELAFQPEGGEAAGGEAIDVRPHRDPAGRTRLLGVGNPGSAPAQGRIRLPGPTTLRDLGSGEVLRGEAGLEVPLPPFSTRLFLVE